MPREVAAARRSCTPQPSPTARWAGQQHAPPNPRSATPTQHAHLPKGPAVRADARDVGQINGGARVAGVDERVEAHPRPKRLHQQHVQLVVNQLARLGRKGRVVGEGVASE